MSNRIKHRWVNYEHNLDAVEVMGDNRNNGITCGDKGGDCICVFLLVQHRQPASLGLMVRVDAEAQCFQGAIQRVVLAPVQH